MRTANQKSLENLIGVYRKDPASWKCVVDTGGIRIASGQEERRVFAHAQRLAAQAFEYYSLMSGVEVHNPSFEYRWPGDNRAHGNAKAPKLDGIEMIGLSFLIGHRIAHYFRAKLFPGNGEKREGDFVYHMVEEGAAAFLGLAFATEGMEDRQRALIGLMSRNMDGELAQVTGQMTRILRLTGSVEGNVESFGRYLSGFQRENGFDPRDAYKAGVGLALVLHKGDGLDVDASARHMLGRDVRGMISDAYAAARP